MTVKLSTGDQVRLVKVHGGWTMWPDPTKEVQDQFTIVAVRVGYEWMKLPVPLTFEAGEAVPLKF